MATMPTRAASLPCALHSILGQVDSLYLYLDGIDEVPAAARDDPRVVPVFSKDVPGLGCDGKFIALVRESEPFLFVGVDDDLVYPPDYVARLAAERAAVACPCIVGVHGVRLQQPLQSYLRDRIVFHFAKACAVREPVHVLGTGTLLFDTHDIRFDPRDWSPPNVTDLQVGLEAAQRSLPLYSIAREAGYLGAIGEAQSDSLYLAMLRDDRAHTLLARRIFDLHGAHLPAALGQRGTAQEIVL
jgi:hypothetical protein